MACSMITFYIVILISSIRIGLSNGEEIKSEMLKSWAERLGKELWDLGEFVTKRSNVIESFKEAKVEIKEGTKVVNELVKDMENMMKTKVMSIKNISKAAEEIALNHNFDEIFDRHYQYRYYNAKKIKPYGVKLDYEKHVKKGWKNLGFTPNSDFFGKPVNLSLSIIHIPTSVSPRDNDLLHGIHWSDQLDSIFKENYKNDPGLTWQFFGSSTGFTRQYPGITEPAVQCTQQISSAMEWVSDPVDMFDCRTRPWYIEAATGPKDILILLDNSGSMHSENRAEIARLVVTNILDTLGPNDFVNVISFVNDTMGIVDCYDDMLVQANMENIRELKIALHQMCKPKNKTNYEHALTTAFNILEQYREMRLGAACNQAIMLVTDFVPGTYEQIFREYNWQTLPFIPVRVFTYLLVKEASDTRDVQWMACANRGYYTHISTMGEVRDQVVKYIPVMARPMVLHRRLHPVIWTPFYADITDPSITDWLWDQEESKDQKQRSLHFRKNHRQFMKPTEKEKRNFNKLRRVQDQTAGETVNYRFMTTVAMPALDLRTTAKVKLGKGCTLEKDPTCKPPQEMKVAFLLGVAGVDVTIEEINQLLKPHLLGVNAYSFIVTNNGYVLTHPDLRPVFQGILKPGYNSVDVTDVELMDDGRGALEFNEKLLEFRRQLVEGNHSNYTTLDMKQHFDNMKRVMRIKRHYFFKPLPDSPFTLVVSLPDRYGQYQVEATLPESHVKTSKGKINYFEGKNWKVHPHWIYCRYLMETEETPLFSSPEEEFEHFFAKTQNYGWSWLLRNQNKIQCDRTLFLSLAYDAKVTSWFTKTTSGTSSEEKRKEFKALYGLTLIFLATRSGLTRWIDFPETPGKEEPSTEHFKNVHNKAIDEVWYKKAVDQNYKDLERFVYSVPYRTGMLGSDGIDENNILVTAANAIFVEKGGERRAPAAAVGFQFRHSALHNLFINITHSCPSISGINCKQVQTCASDSFDCYVLDSNAYIILSESKKYTGYFFGEVEGFIMEQLVAHHVYSRAHIYDYQGVCFVNDDTHKKCNAATLKNPLHYMSLFLSWFIANIMWFLVQFNLQWIGSLAFSNDEQGFPEEYRVEPDIADEPSTTLSPEKLANVTFMLSKVTIKRSMPAPCTMEVDLYHLSPENERTLPSPVTNHCEPPFSVQSIPKSDMILVVVHAACPNASDSSMFTMNVIPSEVVFTGSSFNCERIKNRMPRRRPPVCISTHEKEEDIKICGKCSIVSTCYFLNFISIILVHLLSMLILF